MIVRRVKGWVALAQTSDADLAVLLALHEEDLKDEAQAAGFRPHFETGEPPTGAAFDLWTRQFVAQHQY